MIKWQGVRRLVRMENGLGEDSVHDDSTSSFVDHVKALTIAEYCVMQGALLSVE